MLENKISKWEEERDKRAKGQASFRPKHSTIDHGITLRHIIEKFWEKNEEVFCCIFYLKNPLTWFLGIIFGTKWRNSRFLGI